MGSPRIGDHIGCGLGQWGTPLRRPPLAGPTPGVIPVDPISLYKNFIVVLHTIVFSDLYSISMCKLNRFIVDLSETPRYFRPWYEDTLNWGSYWVWSRPMGDAITLPPIGWSETHNDPC